MAGPTQGGSKTRIIGTGYKPPKTKIHAKWGIVETEEIIKAYVEEYIYYRLQFENIIEGSEEIKAYVYEASHFPRVDSLMEEGFSYHSIYMKTPEIGNWTRTHGGPYYVEVGKNIEIQYHSRMNVTKTNRTLVWSNSSNSTNATSKW
jgi:hypothetical protein